jgi:transposase InsO family protein
VSDIGVGVTPLQEIPARPVSSTPDDVEPQHRTHKEKLLKNIAENLEKNFAAPMFCSHPDSVVHLSVKPEHEDKIFRRQYRMPESLREGTRQILKRWFEEGKIVKAPPGCKYNTPLLVVPKYDKDGVITGIRVCTDVRQLNKYLIENDRFEIPYIPDVLSTFKGAKLFGEFDLKEAFNQFLLAPEGQPLTAFTFEDEQYMFQGCPYGIKFIPSHFQRFIIRLFQDLPFVYPYIDNIVFGSKDWEEHEKHAKLIIDRLTSVSLTIKPNSVNLGNTHLRILGHVISEKGIEIDPEKKRLILDWPRPKTGAELASFLGLGTYLRDHIRHYADLTASLETAKKQKNIDWTENLNRSFELVKRAFSKAPFLKFPDFNKKFAIATDASWIGIGAVLYQPDDDEGEITPFNIVAICSKKLSPTQQRYPVYKKELWAVVYALRKFHSYIWGRPDTIIYTDHKPLIHITNQTNLSASLQQWLDVIMDYNLKIMYRPGILHVLPDALSRMYSAVYQSPDSVWGTMTNLKFVESSFKDLSPSDILSAESIKNLNKPTNTKKKHDLSNKSGEGNNNKNKGKLNFESDIHIPIALRSLYSSHEFYNVSDEEDLKEEGGFSLEDEWEFEESIQTGPFYESARLNILYSQQVPEKGMLTNADDIEKDAENDTFNKNATVDDDRYHVNSAYRKLSQLDKLALAQEKRECIIPPENERKDIIEKAHEKGHFGKTAIYRDITNRKIWWPYIMNDIDKTIKMCRSCQEYTIYARGYHPPQSINASLPGDHWEIDLMEMIESTDGMKYILNVVDVFTGFVMLYAIPNNYAETIVEKLWEMISIFGPPKIISSDNGAEFVNAIIKAFMKHEGISHRLITSWHPQASGKVERVNRTMRDTINKLVRGMHVHWPLYLPFAQLSYNDKVHELTYSTPFALMFARKMNELSDYTQIKEKDRKISKDDWKEHQDEVLSLIYPQIVLRTKQVQKRFATKLEKMRRNIFTRDLPPGTQVMILDEKYLKAPKPKTEPKYIGKYFIVRREVNGPYVIKDTSGNLYHRKVPIDQMKVLFRPGTIPTMEDDKDIWIVEKIINHRKEGRKYEYEIKWKGFTETTWESEDNIIDQNVIDRYWRKQSGMRSISTSGISVPCIYSMTSERNTMFNEADQTAQTQDEKFKQLLSERCVEMEKQ